MIRGWWFISFLFSFAVSAQNKIVDPNAIQQARLNELIIEEVNALRSRKRLDSLSNDKSLLNASQDHVDYMSKNAVLTHVQKYKERKNPIDRVQYYGGSHEQVGENVQLIQLEPLMKKAKGKLTYEKLAKHIVTVWKKSKTHNANMMHPGFSGVSNTFSIRDGALYCCQVLGSKPFDDHYRYTPGDDLFVKNKKECRACKQVQKKIFAGDVNLGWYSVRNDSIFYHNTKNYYKYRWYNDKKQRYRIASRKNNIRKVFKAKGVLAVDLIHHEQIDCEANPSYHNSLYHDGYYLGYITKKQLIEEDLNPSEEILTLFVGMKPAFADTFFQVDFQYLKRRRPCMTNSTIFVRPDYLLPTEYYTIPKPIVGLDKNLIIEDSVVVRIPFRRSQTDQDTSIFQSLVVSLDSLVNANREIQKISFTGVASIEGTEKSNQKLFLRRGKIIEAYLRRHYPNMTFEKHFFENFDDFRSGLASLGYQDLVGFSTDSLRLFANNHRDDPEITQLLDETRYSTVSIIYRDYIPIQEGSYGLSVRRLEDLLAEKNMRELRPLYQVMANKAIDGNLALQDSLRQLEIPDDPEFGEIHWYAFILRLNLSDRPVSAKELNELKRKKAIPTDGDYLELRLMFNIVSNSSSIDVSDYDTIQASIRSSKQQAWIESLKLIMEVQNFRRSPQQAAPIILNNVLKKKFSLLQTYFVCQYFIDWGLSAEPYILLSKFARVPGNIPKLYKQYVKLGYFLQQFDNKREWKKIKRAMTILSEQSEGDFCDLFKWNQMGVRAMEKKEVAEAFCAKCASK